MKQITPEQDDQEKQPANHLMEPPSKMRRVQEITAEPPSVTMITTVSNALTSDPQMKIANFLLEARCQLFARGANGPMSPVSTSALRAMRGAPVIAAMRTAMERAEAAGAGRSKAESS